MTNFPNNGNRPLDIPDFAQENNTPVQDPNTTSTSIDMSIFKMSDDELYDEMPKTAPSYDSNPTFEEQPTKKKKGNGGLIALIIILLVALGACGFFAYKEYKTAKMTNDALIQAQATVKDLQAKLDEKNTAIDELTKTLEDIKNRVEIEVIDGHIKFRKAPLDSGEATTYKGNEYAEDGDKFVLLDVVADADDPEYFWAKIDEEVYFCIGTEDDPWVDPWGPQSE